MTDIDGAVERLKSPTRVGGDGWHDYLAYDEEDVRALLADHARLLSRNAELERALEPFAAEAEAWFEMGDTRPVIGSDSNVTVADLRAAARVLTKES